MRVTTRGLKTAVVACLLLLVASGCSTTEPHEPAASTPEHGRAAATEQRHSPPPDDPTEPSRSTGDTIDPNRAAARPAGEEAVVVHVVDGDTFDAELGNGAVERIRTPQIDTPERDECGFDEAAGLLEELLLGQAVELLPTSDGPDRDPYDRLIRAVEVDGDDVGAILIRSGAARWVPRYARG